MSLVIADRVKETAAAPATGNITLAGAAGGFQSFLSGVAVGNTTYFTISDGGANWEDCRGTLTASTTLTRDATLSSSNNGNPVNFGNAVTVYGTLPAALASRISGANKIINGDIRIDQRNNGAPVTANGAYAADRFELNTSNLGSQAPTLRQSVAVPPSGFENSLLFNVTGTGAAPGTNTVAIFGQSIEGLNVGDLNFGTATARSVTVSFMVLSAITGTFCVSLRNGAANRSYISSYTIATANVWTYVTLTIPGDTAGTWATDTTAGMVLSFDCGSGSTFSTTAGTWQAGNFVGLTSGTKLIATTGAAMYVTGVKLEPGIIATPFVPDDYAVSLEKCQRYCSNNTVFGYNPNANALVSVSFPVPMRAVPTVTLIANYGVAVLPSIVVTEVNSLVTIATGGNATGWIAKLEAEL